MAQKIKAKFTLKVPELVLVGLLLISGIALGFSSGRFIVDLHKVGFVALSTMQKGVHAVTSKVTGTVNAIKETAALRKEYEELTKKLEDYEFLQRNNTEIRKENERLKELLGFATDIEYKNYPAHIIARDPDNQYSGITIDKGARSGIQKGMPVIAVQNGTIGVVGKVVTVGVGTCMVMPLYDVKCNISARIQNTRDIGLVCGNGANSSTLSLKYISKRDRDDFMHGDIVVTSGENDNYMPDIPIGTIDSVEVIDYDSSLNITLKPMIDFSRLEMVIVVDQTQQNDRVLEDAR